MKKLTVIALALALSASAQTTTTKTSTSHSKTLTTSYSSSGGSSSTDDVKDDLFAGTEAFAKNASSATEINMGPDGLGMASGYGKHAAHNMVLNVVRSYSFDKPGMYNMAEVEVYRQKVNTGDWHCSVHTRDMKSGESTDICNKHRTDGLVETAIITVEPKELTFIHTIRKADDGKSEVVEPLISSLGNMTSLAMLGDMAELKVGLAEMQAMHFPPVLKLEMDDKQLKMDSTELRKLQKLAPLGKGDMVLKLKNLAPGETPPAELQLNVPDVETAPGAAPGSILLKLKRDPSTGTPPQQFEITVPDASRATAPIPAAPAPSAPAGAPAPPASQQ